MNSPTIHLADSGDGSGSSCAGDGEADANISEEGSVDSTTESVRNNVAPDNHCAQETYGNESNVSDTVARYHKRRRIRDQKARGADQRSDEERKFVEYSSSEHSSLQLFSSSSDDDGDSDESSDDEGESDGSNVEKDRTGPMGENSIGTRPADRIRCQKRKRDDRNQIGDDESSFGSEDLYH